VNTLDKGNGTGIPPAMAPDPGAPSAQPAALTGDANPWMTPAIITGSGAAVLGIAAAVWAYWWRRRRPATAPATVAAPASAPDPES
jgi:hypothetical protein